MRPARALRSAIGLRASTLMHFHKMLAKQKHRMLFSPHYWVMVVMDQFTRRICKCIARQ
jgi:hypothetical protein